MTRTIVALAMAGFIGHAVSANAQIRPDVQQGRRAHPVQELHELPSAGEIGPMPLLTYKDARPWAKSIATRVTNGTMPPWHADDPRTASSRTTAA